jgi:hypothetical protein
MKHMEMPDRMSGTQVIDAVVETLRRVVASGLLQCGLPATQGGRATLADLRAGACTLAQADPAAGWVLWAQRLFIEAISCSGNVGVREHLLPGMLAGELFGSLPFGLAREPLQATDTGRGWRLEGTFPCVPNLQWLDGAMAAPVAMAGETGWLVLRREESGVVFTPLPADAAPARSRSARVRVNAFVRPDEFLGGTELTARLALVAEALAPALTFPWRPAP